MVVAAQKVGVPYPVFTDFDGTPLESGKVFIGEAGLDPETNPILLYRDISLTLPMSQPVRTLGGYPVYQGSPCNLYVGEDDYSIRVKTTQNVTIFTDLSAIGIANLRADLAAPTGASLVGYNQGGAGAVDQTVQDRLRQHASVKDFGAVGNGTTDDTDAFQRMFDALGYIHMTPGRYKLVAKSTPVYTYGNMGSLSVYRAVDINGSNVSITGEEGSSIYFVGYGTTNAVNYAFATAKNLTLGAISNMYIGGLTFDFNPTGDASINKRSFSLIGVERLAIEDCYLTSLGPRAGATITLQNCKTIRIANLRAYNTTQVMNLSYVYDLVGTNWQFNNFSEAVDFDRQVHGFALSNLTFLGTANNQQCMDMSSVINGSIDGVYAENVGNLFNVDYKPTSPLTYTEYVNNTTPTELTPSRNITISNVGGINVGVTSGGSASSSSISFGIERTVAYNGFANNGPCEDITLRNCYLMNCNSPLLRDVIGLVWDTVVLDGVTSPNATSFGAVTCSANPTYAESFFSAEFRRVKLMNCLYKGLRISSPSKVVLDDVSVDGFNTSNTASMGLAFELTSLNTRQAEIYIDRTYAANGQNTPRAWTFAENGGGAFESKIFWGTGNRIAIATVPTPILFSTPGTQSRVCNPVRFGLGTITLTTGQSVDWGLYYPPANMGAYIAWATATVTQNVGANPTDYLSVQSHSIINAADTTVATYNGTAAITAAAEVDLGLTYNETAVSLEEGDSFYLKFAAGAAGATWNGVAVNLYAMPYQTS